MATKTNTDSLAALATEAEAAVASVKDPELKRVAFDKILSALLEQRGGGGTRAPESKAKSTGASQAREHKGKASAKSRRGPKAYIESLIEDDFFKQQRTIAEVKAELANMGHHVALTSLSGPLQRLTQERKLRRQKITANGKGSKATFAYSNW
jgi:hypothetical protein